MCQGNYRGGARYAPLTGDTVGIEFAVAPQAHDRTLRHRIHPPQWRWQRALESTRNRLGTSFCGACAGILLLACRDVKDQNTWNAP